MQVVMSDIAVTVAVVRSAQAQAQAQVLAARLSTAVNKALARNGGWLQRQTLSSPRNRRATSAHRVRRCNAQQLQRRTAVDGGRPTGGSWSRPQRTVPPLQRAARGVQFWCGARRQRLLLSASAAVAARGNSSRRSHKHINALDYQHAIFIQW